MASALTADVVMAPASSEATETAVGSGFAVGKPSLIFYEQRKGATH
jgi:hypothetical protein